MQIASSKIFSKLVLATSFCILTACGGGGTPTPPTTFVPQPVAPPPPPSAGSVSISGAISFEEVGTDNSDFTFDLSDLTTLPARGIVVEATDAAGAVIASTITNDAGAYAVSVPANTNVRIQARAQLLQTSASGASWDLSVLDNTNDNAAYILAGTLADSGVTNTTRNLFAPSGSDGVATFTGPRTASPFFILDELLNAFRLVESADPSIVFPDVQLFWSVNNRLINDDEETSIEDGDLRSSFFSSNIGGTPTIVLLGDLDTDTDEFDEHVITHEFGHYLTFVLARDDSIGGSHSLSSLLDPRVSFSEGFGNAFSAMATGDPLYIDASFGENTGFAFNIELNTIGQIIENNNGIPAAGWYGSSSVQSIIFDVFDSNSDGVDNISAGFGPIFAAFRSQAFIENETPTTIFSFIDALVAEGNISRASIAPLLDFQDISGTDSFATGETNDGGVPDALPVFDTYTVGDPPLMICSIDDVGTVNRLGNRSLILLTVPNAGQFTISLVRISGADDRDPAFNIFEQGDFVTSGASSVVNSEVQSRFLPAGQLIVDAFDLNNASTANDPEPDDACYNFSVQ